MYIVKSGTKMPLCLRLIFCNSKKMLRINLIWALLKSMGLKLTFKVKNCNSRGVPKNCPLKWDTNKDQEDKR